MEDLDKKTEKLQFDDEDLLLDKVICGDYELLYIDTVLLETFGVL